MQSNDIWSGATPYIHIVFIVCSIIIASFFLLHIQTQFCFAYVYTYIIWNLYKNGPETLESVLNSEVYVSSFQEMLEKAVIMYYRYIFNY